jgi:hypothetical protein
MTDYNTEDYAFQAVEMERPNEAALVVLGENGKPARIFYDLSAMISILLSGLLTQTMIWSMGGQDEPTRYRLAGVTDVVENIANQRDSLLDLCTLARATDISDMFGDNPPL